MMLLKFSQPQNREGCLWESKLPERQTDDLETSYVLDPSVNLFLSAAILYAIPFWLVLLFHYLVLNNQSTSSVAIPIIPLSLSSSISVLLLLSSCIDSNFQSSFNEHLLLFCVISAFFTKL